MQVDRLRRRSVGFLEADDESWSCFLVTYQSEEGGWRGYFSFRPSDGHAEEDEIRTADIFLEESEGQIDQKARGLGRHRLATAKGSSV